MSKGFQKKSDDVSAYIAPAKTIKSKNKQPIVPKTHFDIFSKTYGYVASCMNEDHANKTLQSMYYEHERFWRNARSLGKKTQSFDYYVLVRTGFITRQIHLQFEPDEDDVTDTYEEIAEKGLH